MGYYIGSQMYGGDSLFHFGIKGMRWGVRRFQNDDGTLTEEGRRRYGEHAERVYRPSLEKQLGNVLRNKSSEAHKYDKKLVDSVKRSAVGKEYAAAKKAMRDDWEALEKEHGRKFDIGFYLNGDKTYERFREAGLNYTAKLIETNRKYQNERVSKLLSSMGYSDTKAAREYVRNIIDEYTAENENELLSMRKQKRKAGYYGYVARPTVFGD